MLGCAEACLVKGGESRSGAYATQSGQGGHPGVGAIHLLDGQIPHRRGEGSANKGAFRHIILVKGSRELSYLCAAGVEVGDTGEFALRKTYPEVKG